MLIKVQQEDFCLSDVTRYFEYGSITSNTPDPQASGTVEVKNSATIGAVVTFTGLVREFQHNQDDSEHVVALTLEHYPAMTERVLTEIGETAKTRWKLDDLLIIHRIGTLYPTDNIVLVATASAHRESAFEACQYIMDYLKTSAPFWKKEQTTRGSRWVEARTSDQDASRKWLKSDQ